MCTRLSKPDQAAGISRHQELAQHRRVVAVAFRKPQLHVVVVVDAGIAETRDLVVAAHHHAQRRRDVFGVDSEVGRAVAIDLHLELGLVQSQGRVGIDDADFGRLEPKPLAVCSQRRQFRAANGQIEIPASAPQIERLDVAHAAAQIGELPQPAADVLHHVALRVVVAEGSQRVEPHEARERADPTRTHALRAAPAARRIRPGSLRRESCPQPRPAPSSRPARDRISFSTSCKASFIDARLVPSGAVTLTSNSPSSTPLGTNSWRTSE